MAHDDHDRLPPMSYPTEKWCISTLTENSTLSQERLEAAFRTTTQPTQAIPRRTPHLHINSQLVGKYKSTTYTAHVSPSGAVILDSDPDATPHRSLTAAAQHATGQPSVNGRLFWRTSL